MFLKRIKNFIEKHQLFKKGDRVLVAVSGGVDSFTLLESLFILKKDLKIEIFVSHYDHRIRKNSLYDALTVYRFCKGREIPFLYTTSSVPLYAKREKLSLEMAGRELRYKAWYHLAKKYDFQKIALAHHLDDLVEEVLLRLIRGTGKRGLAGIPIKREDIIVRPLLFVSKKEIKEFALAQGLPWQEDPTNKDLRILRNKIRHLLVPFLEENFNSKIGQILYKTTSLISEEEEFMEKLALENYERLKAVEEEDILLKFSELKNLPAVMRRRIYFLAFKEAGIPLFRITSKHLSLLDNLITQSKTGLISLPGDFLAYRGPSYLRLSKKIFTLPYFEIKIEKEGLYQLPFGTLRVSLISFQERPKQNPKNFILSGETLSLPFIIRKRKPGDRIFFPGVGHKKLKKFLQEKRIPSYLRDQILILEKEYTIIGVWNLYVHPQYLITPETQKIWLLELS